MFRFLKRFSRPKTNSSRLPASRRARLGVEALEQRQLMSAGYFDPTFGNAGRVTANFQDLLGPNATASAVAVQPDGKIVIAGTVNPSAGVEYFAVVRLKADGTPDQTFGADGRTLATFSDLLGGTLDYATAVAIDSQGRIVVAGSANTNAAYGYDFGVVRLNADGYYDTSFGIGGRSFSGFSDMVGGNGDDYASAVAIDAQGRIVVAGTAYYANDASSDFGVVRLNADGYYDTSFGYGGRHLDNFHDLLGGTFDYASAVALDGQGRIVVAGSASKDFGGSDFGVVRLNGDGSTDTNFGIGGRSFSGFHDLLHGTYDYASAVALDGQGRIVVAGTADMPSGSDFGVVRLNDNGYYDTNFGSGGRSFASFSDLIGGTRDNASALAIDYQGRIVVAGSAQVGTANPFGSDFGVVRLNDNGYYDTSFGAGGRTLASFSGLTGGTLDQASAMALDPYTFGNIVVVGTAYTGNNVSNFAVTRIQGDSQFQGGSVADLSGVVFSLTSLQNGGTHPVAIQTQTDNGDGTATITGTWDGQALTGTVQYDVDGNIHIRFSWMGGHGGPRHTFYGTISGDAGAYHLDGMVTLLGSGGPGHCVGDQTM